MNSLIGTSLCLSRIDLSYASRTAEEVPPSTSRCRSRCTSSIIVQDATASFDRWSFDQWESAHGGSNFWYADPAKTILLTIAGRYLPEEAAQGFVEAKLAHPGAGPVLFTVRPDRWLTFDFAKVDELAWHVPGNRKEREFDEPSASRA
jgi:hypothetical protein